MLQAEAERQTQELGVLASMQKGTVEPDLGPSCQSAAAAGRDTQLRLQFLESERKHLKVSSGSSAGPHLEGALTAPSTAC